MELEAEIEEYMIHLAKQQKTNHMIQIYIYNWFIDFTLAIPMATIDSYDKVHIVAGPSHTNVVLLELVNITLKLSNILGSCSNHEVATKAHIIEPFHNSIYGLILQDKEAYEDTESLQFSFICSKARRWRSP